MRRQSYEEKETRRRRTSNRSSKSDIKEDEVLTDLNGKKWRLGRALGTGGFGEIYQVTDVTSGVISNGSGGYVAKLERHSNGPLFVEVNCYLRTAKLEMIKDWKTKNGLSFLGMPHYVASGSHYRNSEKYRFLVLPKYKMDLEQILKEKKMFSVETVLNISIQILHVLEYIHNKGYVHSDIKASNIMVDNRIHKTVSEHRVLRSTSQRNPKYTREKRRERNLRRLETVNYSEDLMCWDDLFFMYEDRNAFEDHVENEEGEKTDRFNEIYLLDYGLASKYVLSNGEHRDFCTDERKAHAGTVLFCSRDAHKGIPSRRSDLESLGYNLVYWLTGRLPWKDDVEELQKVADGKNKCFRKLNSFFRFCFSDHYPQFMLEYFQYVDKLEFQETPDYNKCRKIFENALLEHGLANTLALDFNNVDSWKITRQRYKFFGNRPPTEATDQYSFLAPTPLKPLDGNVIFKRPTLRKKTKKGRLADSMMNWSKILTDPEEILKQSREKKITDDTDGGLDLRDLDIQGLNPTDAMLEVYGKSVGKMGAQRQKVTSVPNIEGYTPAMMNVHTKMTKTKRYERKARVHASKSSQIRLKTCRKSAERREAKHLRRSESPFMFRSRRA